MIPNVFDLKELIMIYSAFKSGGISDPMVTAASVSKLLK